MYSVICESCLHTFAKGNTPYGVAKATHRAIPDSWSHPDTEEGGLVSGSYATTEKVECPRCKKGDVELYSLSSLESLLLKHVKELIKK